MSKNIEEMIKDDEGVDLDHYSLDEIISQYEGVEPVGYQLLLRVYVPYIPEKIGSIFISQDTQGKIRQDAKLTNLTGLVLKIGPDAYKDKTRFSSEPYCKIGDWIQFQRASGYTFSHNKLTSIYLNDDCLVGIVKDPRTIARVVN